MNEAIDRILDLGFLGAIPREDLLSVRPAPDLLRVKTGDSLLWQGEAGEAYFLLLRGRLRRFVEDKQGKRRFVGDVVPGQGVGSSGLLSNGGNAASVRVMRDSEVVRFSRAAFLQIMVLSWEFAIGVSREQVDRVRTALTPEACRATIKTIAVVPIDATVDAAAFVDELSEAIGAMASVAVADRRLMGEAGGDPTTSTRPRQASDGGADSGTLVNRLEALERQHDIVISEVSPEVDAWTRLIVDRSDLVLLLTSVDGTSDPCGVETELIATTEAELQPRVDLVVMHGSGWTDKCNTHRWLDVRDVHEWHHLREGCREDFRRLARILTGNAITVVLGGGGARGLAEVGVVKALKEAGIPIDRFAGTSMGALIGGLLASGLDPDEVAEALRIWVRKGRPGKGYTYPALALVHGKNLHDATHHLLGEGAIEDLPVTFFCVSADLSRNDLVVHDRRSLWRAVRASISVPGMGPPLFDDGRILVDGGTMNNLPADIAASRYGGRIIVVDVSTQHEFSVPKGYDELVPSGWRILWHRLNPFLEPLEVPGIHEVLARAMTLSSAASYRRARELADLSIHPPLGSAGLLDFHAMERLIKIGHEHAAAQLAFTGSGGLRELFPGVESLQLSIATPDREAPPIDRAQFNRILGVGDDETFHEMVAAFVRMFPREIDALARAVARADSVEIRELAHRAKSAATNVAARALTALLQKIELRARDGAVEGLSACLDDVWVEFKRIGDHYGFDIVDRPPSETTASTAARLAS